VEVTPTTSERLVSALLQGQRAQEGELAAAREEIAEGTTLLLTAADMLLRAAKEHARLKAEHLRLQNALVAAEGDDLCEVVVRAITEESARLRAALQSQITWWNGVPSGVEDDAAPNDTSPVDAVAHMAGLAIREAQQALGIPFVPAQEGK
jgi:hypothetical protein